MCGGGPGRAGLGLASIVLTAAGAAVLAQGQILRDPRPYRSSVEITSVNATVRNADGRLVSGLSREAFEVFEDGNPQEITQFTSERVPISLGVLLDASDSMFGRRIKTRAPR
jgi:Ca-activated chloride channel family protein